MRLLPPVALRLLLLAVLPQLLLGAPLLKNHFYTIAHSKRRPFGSGVFECALATVTLSLINLLCYIQHLGYAEMAIYKSAV